MQHFREVMLGFTQGGKIYLAAYPANPDRPRQKEWYPELRQVDRGAHYRHLIYRETWHLRYEPVRRHVYSDGSMSDYQGGQLMFPCDASVDAWDEEFILAAEKV